MKYSLFSRGVLSATLTLSYVGIAAIASSAPVKSSQDLPNFAVVDPSIYRGAAPTEAGLLKLKSMGIQTVIDLRISPKHVAAEKAEVNKLGMTFINLPMGSDPPTPKEQAALLTAFATAPQHPVYVHCQYGADRTGAMVGMYRRTHDHWTYAHTYAEMRHFGFKPYLTKLATYVKNSAPGA